MSIEESIIVSGGMFETLAEVDNKWSKIVQKEYDSLNSSSEKYFKKVAVGISGDLTSVQKILM